MKINRISTSIKEDMVTTPVQVQKIGEYRKGSDQYGALVNSILEWLRTYRKQEDGLKVSIEKFLKETNLTLEELQSFLQNKDKTKLISFDIDIQDGQVIFTNLGKTNKSRYVWENITEVKKFSDY
jgi:hypothetical protein